MSLRAISKKYSKFLLIILGLFVAYLIIVLLRLQNPPEHTHYHANFGLFINGQRDEFKNFTFYEEVQSCADPTSNPKNRVHMHDRINHVAHVHENGVTWGNFFENLGYGLTDKAITTDDGVFVNGAGGKKLNFVLNGQPESNIANRVIKSEDVLLVDYGGKNLHEEYSQITKDAGEYNRRNDPSSCTGSSKPNSWDELKRSLKVWE